MSKKNRRREEKKTKGGRRPMPKQSRRTVFIAIALVVACVAATGIFAARGAFRFSLRPSSRGLNARTLPTPSPTPPPLSKEYVYAGGKMIAVEEGNGSSSCSYQLLPASVSLSTAGGTGSVNVTAPIGCAWTAATTFSWITITGTPGGAGNGTFSYSVAANPGGSRSGSITLADQTFAIDQSGGPCTYSLNPTAQQVVVAGGTFNVTVTTAPSAGCNWTASTTAAWITFPSGSSGAGTAPLSYAVAANSGGTRNGTINVQGQFLTVNQDGVCTYSIAPPTSQNVPEIGTAGDTKFQIDISAGAGCIWSATSNSLWLMHPSSATGTGDTTFYYSADPNPGPQRTGKITVTGIGFSQDFTVTQDAVSDSASFVSQTVPTSLYPGQGQTVSVTMANSGSTTWTPATWVLAAQNPTGNSTWGLSTVPLPTTVPGGGQVTFTFSITAPASEATYNFQWQMQKVGGAYIGPLTPNVAIAVSGSAAVPAPTNLTATVVGSNINLSWQNHVSPANYITIERMIGSGAWSQIATVGGAATTYTDPGLAAGTYTYRVRVWVGNGTASPYSNQATGTIAGTTPPAPSNLNASLGTGLLVNLSWTDNSSNETGFAIERRTGAGDYGPLATVGVNVAVFTDTTAAANTTYTYHVKAVNGTLSSAFSNESTVSTGPPPPPAAPSDLAASVFSSTRVDLTWFDNSTNEDGFKVERKAGTGSFAVIGTLIPNATSYSDQTASASTQYTYQVVSFNAAGGDSAPSNAVPVTTPATGTPLAPTNLQAAAISSSQINLTWTDNSNNEDGFKIERKTGTGAFTEIQTVTAGLQSFSDTGLSVSTQYTYQVRAYAGTNFSGYSNPASATTQAGGPPCPTTTVFSGSGTYGYAEASGTSAQWRKSVGGVVAVDPQSGVNALFIADTENNRIRKILVEGASAGLSSLIAGDGTAGYSDGATTQARFNNPRGVTAQVNGSGVVTALFVADTNNHAIRKIVWGAGVWTTSLFSGSTTGSAGNANGSATASLYNSPQGIVAAPDGFVYVADTGNKKIRKLDASGTSSTLASGFTNPVGITATATAGSPFYVSDSASNQIYQVTTSGTVTSIAGSMIAGFADGTGSAALFNVPAQLVWANTTGGAVLFIADQGNNRIRRLLLSTNAVNTHAGTGTAGFVDGVCTVARFSAPRGITFFASTGAVYVMDTANNRIRVVQ